MVNRTHITEILSLFIFISLVSSAFSEDFKGYKYPDEKFTLNGDNFSIKLAKDWKSIIVRYNDENLLIKTNSCENTQLNFYYICFKGAIVDFSSVTEIGKIDEVTGENIPALNLSVKYQKPDITIKRTFSNKNPIILEEFNAELTIENKGKNPADIIYKEKIPSGVIITNLNGLIYDGNNIIYSGKISQGAISVTSYKLKPLIFSSNIFEGNLTYNYETLSGVLSVEKINITTVDNVKSFVIQNISANLDSSESIKINITNFDANANYNTYFSIEVPKDLDVLGFDTEYDKIESLTNKTRYYFSFNLEKQKSKIIELSIKTKKTGVYAIITELDYTVNNIKRNIQKNININVNAKSIAPELLILDEEITSNQHFKIKGLIKNNDEKISYNNINAKLKSDTLNETFFIPIINQNSELLIFEREITAPSIENKTSINITLEGIYNTINGEIFNFSTKKTVLIHPLKEMIIITHELDKYYNKNDSISVNVHVENKKNKEINVNLNENFSENFEIIGGVASGYLNIGPKRKSMIYTYKLKSENEDSLNISTTLRYTEHDKEFIITQPLVLVISKKLFINSPIKTEIIETNQTINKIPILISTNESIKKTEDKKEDNTSIVKINDSIKKQEWETTTKEKSIWQKFVGFVKGIF